MRLCCMLDLLEITIETSVKRRQVRFELKKKKLEGTFKLGVRKQDVFLIKRSCELDPSAAQVRLSVSGRPTYAWVKHTCIFSCTYYLVYT